MIRILRGSNTALRSYCASLYNDSESTLWLELPKDTLFGFPRYWAGLRYLLPQIRSKVGNCAFVDTVSEHKAAASLILHRLTDQLTQNEHIYRKSIIAKLDSNLSHNWFIQRPFYEDLAALLHKLLSLGKLKIIIPDLTFVDSETAALLKPMHRLFPNTTVEILCGYNPNTKPSEPDKYGLYWRYFEHAIDNFLWNFKSFKTTVVQELSGIEKPLVLSQEKLPPPILVDPLDDDLDRIAYDALQQSNNVQDKEVTEMVIAVMNRAFRSFAFGVALRFGLNLLERKTRFEPEQSAKVHGIIGLSAHNRQFSASEGDGRFNDFLEYHFREALKNETDSGIRLCHYYRIIVTISRRKGNLLAALQLANQALEEAQNAELAPEQAVWLEGWIRNIRAYIHWKNSDFVKAAADCEISFEKAREMASKMKKLSRDMIFSCSIFAGNRATVEKDKTQEDRWRDKAFAVFEPFALGARWWAEHKIKYCRSKFMLREAARAALLASNDARVHIDPRRQDFYLVQLFDLHYRLADIETSFEYYREARILYQRMNDSKRLSAIKISAVPVAIRAGHFDEAQNCLEHALLEDHQQSIQSRAEILSLMALLAATRGDASEAEQKMNEAIDWAVEGGARDNLLLVARTAGDVCQKLGRCDEALQAYRQAMEISKAKNGESASLPDAELLNVLLGLLECGEKNTQSLLHALQMAPNALRSEDPEAWWALPRLLSQLLFMADKAIDLSEFANSEVMKNVLTAATQRDDCQRSLNELYEVLPAKIQIDVLQRMTPSETYLGDEVLHSIGKRAAASWN